jgi:hypothetical protein
MLGDRLLGQARDARRLGGGQATRWGRIRQGLQGAGRGSVGNVRYHASLHNLSELCRWPTSGGQRAAGSAAAAAASQTAAAADAVASLHTCCGTGPALKLNDFP